MNGQGKLLTHYLKNADKLIIPVYQRNYDWREEHCKKLYQDLVRTIHLWLALMQTGTPFHITRELLLETKIPSRGGTSNGHAY